MPDAHAADVSVQIALDVEEMIEPFRDRIEELLTDLLNAGVPIKESVGEVKVHVGTYLGAIQTAGITLNGIEIARAYVRES